MGRIAPRRRKTTRIYQPLLRTWLNISQRLKPAPHPRLKARNRHRSRRRPTTKCSGSKRC